MNRKRFNLGCLMLTGLVLLAIVWVALSGGSPKTGAASAHPTPTTAVSSSPETRLTSAIRAAHLLGKIDKLSVFASAGEEGKWIVDVHLQLENVTDVGPAALMDFFAIDKAAYTAGVPLQWVALTGAYPMRDSYGNAKLEDVVVLKLPEATAERVNWAGITYQDVWKISDKILVVPAFARTIPSN